MQAIVDPKLYKHTTRISPGIVGSVGDVNILTRLAQSTPEMPMRYDQELLQREPAYGSNVQNGSITSFSSHGGPARVVDKRWSGERSFKTQHGWKYQDIRAPDRRVEPLNIGTPGYDWYNQIATVYKAKTTGNQFLPLPNRYELPPGDVPRGGMLPRLTATEMTVDAERSVTQQPVPAVKDAVVQAPPSTGFFTPEPAYPDYPPVRYPSLPSSVTTISPYPAKYL